MKISCGILPYRINNGQLEVFLVHPGGPFFAKKDIGFWGISKGQINTDEEPIDCAIREFKEETSMDLQLRKSKLISIGEIVQENGKLVYAWAIEDGLTNIVDQNGIADLRELSNKVQIKLKFKTFEAPEIDTGRFFKIEEALVKMNESQKEFIKRIQAKLESTSLA